MSGFARGCVWLVMIGCGAASACAPARLAVPSELEAAPRLSVEGRGGITPARAFRFGGWEATGIERSWVKGSGLAIGAADTEKARQTYRFAVREDGVERWRGECESHASRGDVDLGVVQVEAAARATVTCTFSPSDGAPWSLHLASDRHKPLEGLFSGPDASFRVAEQTAGPGLNASVSRGFQVRRGEVAVAAVETPSGGAVWLGGELAPVDRSALAALASALLIFERIQLDG